MRRCYDVATKSKDQSTKFGAVLVHDGQIISEGWNGFPRKINDDIPERHARPEKYFYVIHSEQNAILNAARKGISTLGADLYIQGLPCPNCAGAIIQAGIKNVFCHKQWRNLERDFFINRPPYWRREDITFNEFNEAGIKVFELDIPVIGRDGYLDGKTFKV